MGRGVALVGAEFSINRRHCKTIHSSNLKIQNSNRLAALLRKHSVKSGDFVLASGARSSIYVDCRATTSRAEGQYLVGQACLSVLSEAGLEPESVGGLTMGADPVSYAIAHASWIAEHPIHAFSVRKEPKAHGTGKLIEGSFVAGARVVVIEDVITSGGSALKACEAVKGEGGEVMAVLSLIDRESGGREALEAAGYKVLSVFRISELLAGGTG